MGLGVVVMRVTLAERLGIRPNRTTTKVMGSRQGESAPHWVEPEKAGPVVRLAECPSSPIVPYESYEVSAEDEGPPRVRGEMVWLHKTAPILVIEGRSDVSPEDHESGRRR